MQVTKIQTFEANGTTMCVITAVINGERRTFTGAASLHPDDTNRSEIGREVATARAFTNMANRLSRRARGLVKHQDDLAAKKAAAVTKAPVRRRGASNSEARKRATAS